MQGPQTLETHRVLWNGAVTTLFQAERVLRSLCRDGEPCHLPHCLCHFWKEDLPPLLTC